MASENQDEVLPAQEVTELHRRIAELEQQVSAYQLSAELYRALIQNSLHGLALVQDWRIVFANARLATLTGYAVDELVNLPAEELIACVHPEDRAMVMQRWRDLTDGTLALANYSYRFIRKDGSVCWIENFVDIVNYKGQPAIQTVVVDVTDRVMLEQSLRASEESYRRMIDTAQEGVWVMDGNYRVTFVNLRMTQMLGYTVEEMIGRPVDSFMFEEDLADHLDQMRARYQGEPARYERRFRHKEGSMVWTVLSATPIMDAAGGFGGSFAMFTDITERKQMEQAQRDQRVLAEALRDTASLLTSTLDSDEVLDRILENVGRVVPHDAASILLIGSGMVRVAHERGYAAPGLEEWLKTAQLTAMEVPNWRRMYETKRPLAVPDTCNDPRWTVFEPTNWIRSFAGAPILIDGQVIGFLNLYSQNTGFFRESQAEPLQSFANQAAVAIKNARLYREIEGYTVELEQRVAERTAQLNQAKEHVETILNSSSDVIMWVSRDGMIQQVNPVFKEVFHSDPGEIIGESLTTLVEPENEALLMGALQATLAQKRSQRLEIEVLYKDYTMFDADIALSPIMQGDGQVAGVVGSLRDITLHKKNEDGLRRMLAQEIELGELKSRFISTTSHEFRTPLAIIQASSDVLARYSNQVTEEQKQKEYRRIRMSIMGMVTLLDDILIISRSEQGKLEFIPEPMNLETYCRDMMAIFELSSGREHRFAFSYTGSTALVSMDPRLLRHIVSNLLSNAVKYSPAGSTVTFDVGYENNRAILRIKDEGIGIPEADRTRLFEPFHRARNVGAISGTGLGLAVTRRAVDLHGGRITVESREGTGTTFTVMLPNVEAAEGE